MRVKYRGHLIDVKREMCLAGYELLYIYIERLSDGVCIEATRYDGAETVREMIQHMKGRVDAEIEEALAEETQNDQ